MEGGRVSAMMEQDNCSFEDALRRLNALELKLTEQVKIDIRDLKQQWILPKVDRVTRNAYKLFQVREQLKLSKVLFVEEEQILCEFNSVKELIRSNSMDEEEFEATKETCIVLGMKLSEVRGHQNRCYNENKDLELVVNRDIMTLKIEEKDLSTLDIEHVRASTPVRQLSPTPLVRHRSMSREPSPFRMPALRIPGGAVTPGGSSVSDPHAYFSRSGSSQSLYGGRGQDPEYNSFRAAMEAKQAEDDSPPAPRKPGEAGPKAPENIVLRSASGQILSKSESGGHLLAPGAMFNSDRPASALSDMSINMQDGGDVSRPGSRMSAMGDVVSSAAALGDFTQRHEPAYPEFEQDEELAMEMEINFAEENKRKEEDIQKKAMDEANMIRDAAQKDFEEKERRQKEEERKLAQEKEEKAREKKKQQDEEDRKERELRKQEEDKKFQEREEKRRLEKEKREADEKKKKEEQQKKIEDERQRKLDEKKEKKKKEDEALAAKQEKEAKALEEKARKAEEKKQKLAEARAKKAAEEEVKKAAETELEIQKLVEAEAKAKENEATKKEQALAQEKKSLQKDVADLERELQIAQDQPDSEQKQVELPATKKRSVSKGRKQEHQEDAEQKVAVSATEENKRSLSRGRKEASGQAAEEKKRSLSKGRKSTETEEGVPKGRSRSKDAKQKADDIQDIASEEPEAIDPRQPRSLSKGKPEDENKKRSVSRGKKEAIHQVNDGQQEVGKDISDVSSIRGKSLEKPNAKTRSLSREAKAGQAAAEKPIADKEDTNEQVQPARGRRDDKKETASSQQKSSSKGADSTSSGISGAKRRDGSGEGTEHRSKSGSRQASRTGSPVSILKKGGSRDASKDRSGLEAEDLKTGKPVSRSGSLKKSASFNKKALFADKKKISFDEDVDIEKFDTENEPLNSAKEIFAAIANTSLDAGLTGRSQKSRDSSGDRMSGASSRNDFSPAEPADYFPPEGSEIDNEDELMIIIGGGDNDMMDSEEAELAAIKSRSESRERPGSLPGLKTRRGSDDKYPKSLIKSRSGSNVPELETIQDEFSREQQQNSGKRSLSMDRKEEPRPASTGYTQLDEFERKLMEMESELVETDAVEPDMAEEMELGRSSPLKKASNTWDLSPQLDRAVENNDFSVVAEEFKASIEKEDIYAKVLPKSQRPNSGYTEDGYVINTETELADLAHSGLKSEEYMGEEEGSEYVFDMTTGEKVRRSKKVSFAEYEEKFEIERESQVTGLGKLFGFGPPKPMRPLPGKEKSVDTVDNNVMSSRRSSSKEPSPMITDPTSPKAFLAAMTGSFINKSPETGRKDQSSLSLFGSLLRKGRKSSRSGSKSGSRTSSAERGSQDLGSEDHEEGSVMRTSSRGSNNDEEDARSDSSFAQRLGHRLKKKKPPKVNVADFDELFARGMAKSAQLESENNRDPFKAATGAVEETIQGTAGNERYDENGARFTPFEVYSHDAAFKITQKGEGIGYAEKVMSYLDDQAHTPRTSLAYNQLEPVATERGRERKKKQSKEDKSRSTSKQEPSAAEPPKRKISREYSKPEDVKFSPMPKRDLFTGEELPPSPEAVQMLKKIADFVASHEIDSQYTQPVWPATASTENMPQMKTNQEANTNKIGAPASTQQPSSNATATTAVTAGAAAYDPAAAVKTTDKTVDNVYQTTAVSPPRPEEPADKGLPTQLQPDKLMRNEEFYEKLRSGLKKLSLPPEDKEVTEEVDYNKYSHHLGRAEFGTLRRREPSTAVSRDPSGDRKQPGLGSRDPSGDRVSSINGSRALSRNTSGDQLNRGFSSRNASRDRMSKLSRNTSFDKMNEKLRKASRQGSELRSDSRLSDYSTAIPDLESDVGFDPAEQVFYSDRDDAGAPSVQRTQSLIEPGVRVDRPVKGVDQELNVHQRKEEVLKDIAQHKQQIKEAKAWVQNGLMGAVGFCMVVYLQSLEMMAGGH